MKRSDIHVGDELYYDRSTNWQLYAHGGQKAIVVDTQPRAIRKGWGHREPHYADPNGKAVLIKVITGDDGEGYEIAVPTTHLRGPYEATQAQVEKTSAAARERRDAESKKTQDIWANASALRDRAEAAGIIATARRIEGVDGPMMTLTPADLAKLLDAYSR